MDSIYVFLGLAAVGLYLQWMHQKTKRADGTRLHPDVDTKEFSQLLAAVLCDERGRKALVPLLNASGNNVTQREMTFFRYMVGKGTMGDVVQMIEARRYTDSSEEARILCKQVLTIRDTYPAKTHSLS
jgi:hypothetical protein